MIDEMKPVILNWLRFFSVAFYEIFSGLIFSGDQNPQPIPNFWWQDIWITISNLQTVSNERTTLRQVMEGLIS